MDNFKGKLIFVVKWIHNRREVFPRWLQTQIVIIWSHTFRTLILQSVIHFLAVLILKFNHGNCGTIKHTTGALLDVILGTLPGIVERVFNWDTLVVTEYSEATGPAVGVSKSTSF